MTSVCSSLASNALRVYLTYTLFIAEGVLKELTSAAIVSKFDSENPGEESVVAASRVVRYIKNCQHDDHCSSFFPRGVFALCAIESAQDALLATIRASREIGRTGSVIYKSIALQRTRATKYMVNALLAEKRDDLELASLWSRAVKRLCHETDVVSPSEEQRLPRDGDVGLIKNMLKKAAVSDSLEISLSGSVGGAQSSLHRLAARHFRLAAAYMALHTKQSRAYKWYALGATCYLDAAECRLSAGIARVNGEEQLWLKAADKMELAGRMCAERAQVPEVRTDVDSVDLPEDAVAKAVIAAAQQLICDAKNLPQACEVVDTLHRKLAESRSVHLAAADARVQSVYAKLISLQTEACLATQQYLGLLQQGGGGSKEVMALELEARRCRTASEECATRAKQVIEYIEKHVYFLEQACCSVSYEWSALLQSCWMSAATHMESAIQHAINAHIENNLTEPSPVLRSLRFECTAVRAFVSIAVDWLGTVRDYEAQAALALRGGCCPQEALFRRTACDLMLQAAQLRLQEVQTDVAHSMPPLSPSKRVMLKEHCAETFARAAEYAHMSRQISGATEGKIPFAVQVRALWRGAAEAQAGLGNVLVQHGLQPLQQAGLSPPIGTLADAYREEVRHHLQAIDVIMTDQTAEESSVTFLEMMCFIATARSAAVSQGRSGAAESWAFALQYGKASLAWQHAPLHPAHQLAAAVSAVSARAGHCATICPGQIVATNLWAFAGKLLRESYDNSKKSAVLSALSTCAARRLIAEASAALLVTGFERFPLPEWMTSEGAELPQQITLGEELLDIATDIASAYHRHAASTIHSDSEKDEFPHTKDATDDLVNFLFSLGEELVDPAPSEAAHQTVRTVLKMCISLCKLQQECCISSVRAHSASLCELSHLWLSAANAFAEAVKLHTRANPDRVLLRRRKLVVHSAERLVLAAEALANEEAEVSRLWVDASFAAASQAQTLDAEYLSDCSSLLRLSTAALRARRLYHHLQKYLSRAADQRAQSAAAAVTGQAEVAARWVSAAAASQAVADSKGRELEARSPAECTRCRAESERLQLQADRLSQIAKEVVFSEENSFAEAEVEIL